MAPLFSVRSSGCGLLDLRHAFMKVDLQWDRVDIVVTPRHLRVKVLHRVFKVPLMSWTRPQSQEPVFSEEILSQNGGHFTPNIDEVSENTPKFLDYVHFTNLITVRVSFIIMVIIIGRLVVSLHCS